MGDSFGLLSSEFATVALRVDERGNGPRLRIEDVRTGFVGYLDPLQLETLAWLPGDELDRFLDPSYHRWREAQGNGKVPALSPSPSHRRPPGSRR